MTSSQEKVLVKLKEKINEKTTEEIFESKKRTTILSLWEKIDYSETNSEGKFVNPHIKLYEDKPLQFNTKSEYVEWTEKIKINIKESIKKRLTPMEYNITQNKANEKPFTGVYSNHYDVGIYSCKVCTQKLFSNTHRYKSDSGWTSFWNFIPFSIKLSKDYLDNWNFQSRSGLHTIHNDNLTDPLLRVACSHVSSLEFYYYYCLV
jgi:hypothetical protein